MYLSRVKTALLPQLKCIKSHINYSVGSFTQVLRKNLCKYLFQCSCFKCHSRMLLCRKLWGSLYLDCYTPALGTLTYSSQESGPVLKIKWELISTDISLAVYFGFVEVSLSFNSSSKTESSDYHHHLPLICSYDRKQEIQ